jgi:glycosyltransferase involved in cell wall biosynthesis
VNKLLVAMPLNYEPKDHHHVGALAVGRSLIENNLKFDSLIVNDAEGYYKGYGDIVHCSPGRNHLKVLSGIIQKSNFDVCLVILNNMSFFKYIKEIARSPNTTYIMYHQGAPDVSTEVSYMYRQEVIDVLQYDNVIQVFVSKNHRDRFFAHLAYNEPIKNKVMVIHPGISMANTKLTSAIYDISVVARVDKSKFLMETLKYSTELGLSVVHCGKTEPYYNNGYDVIYNEYNPENLIKLGSITNQEVLNYVYGKCKVNFSMSRAETFGLYVIEAAACGVPSIVPDTAGGPIEIIEQLGCGAVLNTYRMRESKIIENFKTAYEQLKNITLEERIKLRETTSRFFSIQKTVSEIQNLVDSI